MKAITRSLTAVTAGGLFLLGVAACGGSSDPPLTCAVPLSAMVTPGPNVCAFVPTGDNCEVPSGSVVGSGGSGTAKCTKICLDSAYAIQCQVASPTDPAPTPDAALKCGIPTTRPASFDSGIYCCPCQ
jgi:hypothetical protein